MPGDKAAVPRRGAGAKTSGGKKTSQESKSRCLGTGGPVTRQDARQQSAEQASKPQSGERLVHPTEGQSKAESKAHVSNLQQAPLKRAVQFNRYALSLILIMSLDG